MKSLPAQSIVLCLCASLMLAACDQPPGEPAAPADKATTPAAIPAPQEGTHVVTSQSLIGQPRPDFSLPDLQDKPRQIKEWDGKVLVLNFWATWCPPCVREMPFFVEMQEQYGERGLQFIGIAIDDKQMVQDFIDTMGVAYPVLIGAADAIEVSKRYGNRFGALPYSVIIDRSGKIAHIQQGELLQEVAEKIILPLL